MQTQKTFNQWPLKKLLPALTLPMALTSMVLLSGCNEQAAMNTDAQPEVPQTSEATAASEVEPDSSADTNELDTGEQVSTRNQPLSIDWSRIDSGQNPVATEDFTYPFELEGDSVKSQAKFSDISPKQAQHSLTVGMASNEPLEKLLDQLGDSYLSHKFSESEAKLIVYTTPNVKPSQHDYVIAHEFAQGLTLPIEIIPQPKTEDLESTQPDDL